MERIGLLNFDLSVSPLRLCNANAVVGEYGPKPCQLGLCVRVLHAQSSGAQGAGPPGHACMNTGASVQVDADPSNGRRAALRSEDEIARLIGRSNIVSKVDSRLPLKYCALACVLTTQSTQRHVPRIMGAGM